MTQRRPYPISFIFFFGFIAWAASCSGGSDDAATTDSDVLDSGCEGDDCATDTGVEKTAKYVFYLIGDGMGTAHVEAAERYSLSKNGEPLHMTGLDAHGLTVTHSDSTVYTDSAAAATALACGQKTELGVLAMNPEGTEPYVSIAELARDAGMKVGIISNVPIDQATPAAFYAKAPSRRMRYEIALQLATSGFDFFGGGGFSVNDFPGEDMAERELLFEQVKSEILDAGYVLAEGRTQIDALSPVDAKVVAINGVLDSYYAMPYELDRRDVTDSEDMSLVEIVDVAVSRLSEAEDGFFLMVEGGRIDWSGHDFDSAALVYEMLAFDAVVARALSFYEKHPDDTLIVVTADHECGGLINREPESGTLAFHELLELQRMSRRNMGVQLSAISGSLTGCDEVYELIEQVYQIDMNDDGEGIALDDSERTAIEEQCEQWQERLFAQYSHGALTEACGRVVDRLAGLEWTVSGHTPEDVPVYAQGVGAEMFDGTLDNTDVFHFIKRIMGL